MSNQERDDETRREPVEDASESRLALEVDPRFFRDTLAAAMDQRGVRASEQSELYLTTLLTDHLRSAEALGRLDSPFSVRLAHAMAAEGSERFDKLRILGDDVLFTSGFFAEHLQHRGLATDYVTGMGQLAYCGAASVLRTYTRDVSLFDELAARFQLFVDLLRHVADSLVTTSLRKEADILKLYERWSRTGSDVLATALGRLGVVPVNGTPGLN